MFIWTKVLFITRNQTVINITQMFDESHEPLLKLKVHLYCNSQGEIR